MLPNRLYLALMSSHLVIDMFTGICGVLLAVLSVPLGLSNAQIGTATTLYILASALSQPLFGWFADRQNTQPLSLVSLSIVWMAAFFSLVAFTPSWGLVVVFLLLAALGSGLFHPIGTSQIALLNAESANTNTAFFFLFGQMGLALGPMIGGVLFDAAGTLGILPLAALSLFPAVLMWSALRSGQAVAAPQSMPVTSGAPQSTATLRSLLSLAVLALVALVALRSSIQATYQFLMPKLFEDRGWEASMYGLLAGVFMATAALGNVLIGRLADHFGTRTIVVLSLLLSVPVGLLFLNASSTLLVFVACGLSGLLVGGQHSVLVVYAQRMLPVRKGLAAGLILGFTFASGALGVWLCAIAGDIVGLHSAMQAMAFVGLPAALLALSLPGIAHAVPEAEAVPASPQPATRS
jgi:FSR family fosmidomycin resistance protein-like MFS transporter